MIFTAFKQENVRVTYNGDKEPAVGDIRTGSLKTAEILPDKRRITEVKSQEKFLMERTSLAHSAES